MATQEDTRFVDLGWDNNLSCRPEIEAAVAFCQAAKHRPTDIDMTWPRGVEHVVTCQTCQYVYRYDSGD